MKMFTDSYIEYCREWALCYLSAGSIEYALNVYCDLMRMRFDTREHESLGLIADLVQAGKLSSVDEVKEFLKGVV